MLILLPFLLLISSVLAAPPKCPDGTEEDGTFSHGSFYYECNSGIGRAKGCMTKEGEAIAFGDKSVLSKNHNGEIALHCYKKDTEGGFEYGSEVKFDKSVDELRCENGKKIGEEYINKRFVRRCNVSEFGNDVSDVIGCLAKDNTTTIPVGQNITIGRFVQKCYVDGNSIMFSTDYLPEIKFLNCNMPNGLPVGLGKSQKYQGKTYTCKSESELVVE